MINFDAVDFSERRSEEVISFFWRSVYVSKVWYSYGIMKKCNKKLYVNVVIRMKVSQFGEVIKWSL